MKDIEIFYEIIKKIWNYWNSFFFKKNIFVHCYQPKNDKNNIIFYLEKEINNAYKVYYIFALDNEDKPKNLNDRTLEEIIKTEKDNLIYFPITVFCKKISQEKMPFIPDYDLFAVCWKIDYSIKHHQPRIPTNSFARMKIQNNIVVDQEKDFKSIFKKPHSVVEGLEFDQDPEVGNALSATKDFLDRLNKNLGYEKGLADELCPVHHTFELVNPYSKGFNENFYTILLPNPELVTDFDFPQEMRVKK